MTPPPQPGGNPGQYEEELAQWFLERTFFLDFVYRNPRAKGGKGELSDAVVLFEDTALMVQVKAQFSPRPVREWSEKKLNEAVGQLHYTNRMLYGGHVRRLVSATLGEVTFEAVNYPKKIGLIIIEQPPEQYLPDEIFPNIDTQGFPIHIFSLFDFLVLSRRFDTAGDFLTYLDFREDLKTTLSRQVHDEKSTLTEIMGMAGEVLRRYRPAIPKGVLERSVGVFRRQASGELIGSHDYRFSLAIDDIVARLHDRDPSLSWNTPQQYCEPMKVAEQLSWLTRTRRIELGKTLLQMSKKGQDGKDHYFAHFQRPVRRGYVFLVTSMRRADRVRFLEFLAAAGLMKYGTQTMIGVATEPVGAGRSYDVVMLTGEVTQEFREKIREFGEPFTREFRQLIP
jgi:hypothetical protein